MTDLFDPKNKSSTEDADIGWLPAPSGILIMGKRQGTKSENKQLWGRIAMAAALWHCASHPKPYILYVASDVHGSFARPDVEVVKSLLINQFDISSDYIILRCKSNCTLIEARLARILRRVYSLEHVFAITHLYHAPRTQRYLNEVLSDASVIPAHPDILMELNFSLEKVELWANLQAYIADSLPGPFDLMREQIVEALLGIAHALDPRGKVERRLAKILRPTA
jgi:hypothetical protein